MPIFETYSKRLKKKSKAGIPDVYTYSELPPSFRVQVIHIWMSAIGHYNYRTYVSEYVNDSSSFIHDTLAREVGVFNLGQKHEDPFVQCQSYLLNAKTEQALDIIELSFRVIDIKVRNYSETLRSHFFLKQLPDDAIVELNHRFREHNLGFQFINREIIRIDSEYIHTETVMPAIALLQDRRFRGASEEFMNAHEHYRSGRNKEAIAEALKSLESTIKTICDLQKWSYPPNATAAPLIELIFKNKLLPPELTSEFTALQSVMNSGLPTVRNMAKSSHGQGAKPVEVPDYLASYALHLAATNIVFLIEAFEENHK